MMDLAAIPQELLVARGQYATIRAAHEDAKKQMQILCGGLGATAAQVLRAVQPDNDAVHDAQVVADLLASCRKALEGMEACADTIRALAAQRADLKPKAWPK